MDWRDDIIDDEDVAPACAVCDSLLVRYSDQHHVTYDSVKELSAVLCTEHNEMYETLIYFSQAIGYAWKGSTLLNFMKMNHGRK